MVLNSYKQRMGRKAFALVTLLTLLATVAFTAAFIFGLHRSQKNQLYQHGQLIASMTARQARLGVLAGSADVLDPIVKSAFADDTVTNVIVTDSLGRTLIRESISRPPAPTAEQNWTSHPEALNPKTLCRRLETSTRCDFICAVTTQGSYASEEALFIDIDKTLSHIEVIGFARVTLDKTPLNNHLVSLIWRSALVGLGCWFLASLVTCFFLNRLVHPLARLTQAARSMEKGESIQAVPVETDDEVGQLALAFNEMIHALQSRDAALRQSESKYRSIFENATEGIFQADLEGRVVTANPALARILGFSNPDRLLASGVNLVRQLRLDGKKRDRLRQALTHGETELTTTGKWRREETAAHLFVRFHAVTDERGQLIGYEGIVADITRERRLQIEKEAAEAASQAKSAFLAKMSHDLRTPISAIIGMSDLLTDSDPSPRRATGLSKIRTAARSLLGIINDMLDLATIEAGKLRLDRVELRLAEVRETVASVILPLASKKGVRFEIRLSDGIPPVLIGDPGRLSQVLINLCGNAVAATPAGGTVIVQAEVLRREATRVRLTFSVIDSGPGIPEDQKEDLFAPFVRGKTPSTQRGSGLGLAICRELTEMMGGRIWVESKEGAGSQFHFTCLLGWREQPSKPVHQAPLPARQEGKSLSGYRMLVVEDEPILRDVAQTVLADAGSRVDTAENGAEALDRLRQAAYDAVLMDVQMPEIDGYEATRRIRRDLGLTEIPIIAMTAHAMAEDRDRCLAAGMNDYLAKPLDREPLLAALARHLSGVERSSAERPSRFPALLQPRRSNRADRPPIDIPSALRRVLGNRRRLRALLRQVKIHYAETANEIREAIERADMDTARRLAHTLAGVAGTLSAQDLFAAASALSADLRSRSAGGLPALDRVTDRLDELIAAIPELLLELADDDLDGSPDGDGADDTPANPPANPLDLEAIQTTVVRLSHLLETNNLQAEAVAGDLADALQGAGPEIDAPVERLREAVDRLDYAAGRQALSDLRSAIPLTLKVAS